MTLPALAALAAPGPLAGLPALVAVPAALLLLAGAGLALLGAVGLVRLRSFYERLHAPTIATSLGMGCTLLSSMLVFSALQERPVLHELVIGGLLLLTTPITLMLLGRAGLYRDRAEGLAVPPAGSGAED